MWQVLRRYQNEEYKSAEESAAGTLADGTTTNILPPNIPENDTHPNTTAKYRFELAMRQIYLHEAKPDPKPLDPLVLTTPYDRLVYAKIAANLSHENVSMRRAAIEQLLELYGQKPEHVILSLKPTPSGGASGMNTNMLDVLCVSLNDPDEELRVGACRALQYIMREAEGQKAALQPNKSSTSKAAADASPSVRPDGTNCSNYNFYYFEKFLAILDDEDPIVVSEGLKVLASCHMYHNEMIATKHLIKLGCLNKYVEKIRVRHEGIAGNACEALVKALDVKEAFVFALDAGAMEALTNVMAVESDPFVLTKAAEATTKLCFYGAGKRAGFKHNTIKSILPHIRDESSAVRTAMAGALAALTVYVPGRQQALDLDVIVELVAAITSEEQRDVLANHMNTICNMAEHPQGRFALKASAIPRLQEIVGLTVDYPQLHEAAIRAIKVIQWVPGDPQ